MRTWVIFFAVVGSSALADTCLPKFVIHDEELACTADADCDFVGDGCRSCQHPVANKKFKAAIESRDVKARQDAQCVVKCEACRSDGFRPVCRAKRCEAAAQK